MIAWQKTLRIGKTDRYSVDVTNFADGQSITSATFASSLGLATIGATDIDGFIISALCTGVTSGTDIIDVDYSTSTRSDCLKSELVIRDC